MNKKYIILAVAVAAAIAAAVFKVDISAVLTNATTIQKQIEPLVEDEKQTP